MDEPVAAAVGPVASEMTPVLEEQRAQVVADSNQIHSKIVDSIFAAVVAVGRIAE
jgi:hypothetical protein